MANKDKEKINHRLKSLEEIDGVHVEFVGENQVLIRNEFHYSPDFRFKWIDQNHYVGYFEGPDGTSQAILSLWNPLEAIRFAALYVTLVELRAKRDAPVS